MPADGRLAAAGLDGLADIPFGMYVHVPFCRTRCGYCDFNTYTAAELGGGGVAGRATPAWRSRRSGSRARVLGDGRRRR